MRRTDIDFIKYVASILIVFFHAINPGKGLQQCVYLLGAFGIPLFFVVNGYLMTYKNFSFKYVASKALSYSKFLLIWGLIVGILFAIKEKSFLEIPITIIGVFTGKGHLYQLWFLPGLLIIYFLCFILERFNLKREKIYQGGYNGLIN